METSIMETKRIVNLFLENPTQENFNVLQYDALGLSLVYRKIQNKKKLTDFLVAFNEDALIDLYYRAFGDLKIAIAQSISRFDKTLEEWVWFYLISFPDLKKLALIKIKSVNDYSFEGWENMLTTLKKFNKTKYVGESFHEISNEESGTLEALILSKMDEHAKTIEHWGSLYMKSRGSMRVMAFDKLNEMV